MYTSNAAVAVSFIGEMNFPLSFGEWLKRRRKALDLTQAELAKGANCTIFALRKIEAGERRPSKQLATLLAQSIEIPADDQITFVKVARGELSVERLSSPDRAPSGDFRPAQNPNPSPGNLPRQLTHFFGREPELNSLGQLLCDPQCRLLTLVGPGGIGKTRLAVEAANLHTDLFPDGIWFVSLAPLISPAFLIPAIADAMNFGFQDSSKPQVQLLNYLRDKRALLVLDNAEHLLDGLGVVLEILENSPQVKLLVTSCERLNLLSEWVFEIQGLPVPPSDQADQFEAYSSVALFLQSARRTRAGFELRADDRNWVIRICQIMEGMPLGIELAAAWVELLPCEEIAKEIERNLDFLSVSMRDLPERHRSMRATLDHSWSLLNAEEKIILSRLSVFQGSFRREAAQEICGANLAILSSLKNKMLLYRTDNDYYSLHELIRQYAALKLAEDGSEDERVKDQHALYYARRLCEWEKALKGSRQVETLNEMAPKIDNLRQGWQRMVTCCQSTYLKTKRFDPSLFHSSLFSLSLFYEMRCRNWEAITVFTESVECLKAARAVFDGTEDCLCFDSVLGHLTAYLGLHHAYILQFEQGRMYLEEALRLLAHGQSKIERAQAQVMLAWIYLRQGHLKKSEALLEQSREVFREEGDAWWYLLSLINLAWTCIYLGKIEESLKLYREGFPLVNPGDLRLGLSLQNAYAYACYLQNDYALAEQLLEEDLKLSHLLGFDRQTANVHIDLAQVALDTNRIDLAEQYIQESIDLIDEYGDSYLGLIYSGKVLIVRLELDAARDKFRQVIKIGQTLGAFYLVYWGMANIARTFLIEGQIEKALEMALVLKQYPVEIHKAQEDGMRLLADLQSLLPEQQIEAAMQQAAGRTVESLLDLV